MSLPPDEDRTQRSAAVPTAWALAALAFILGTALLAMLITGSSDCLVPLASLVTASAAWAGLRWRR